MSVLLSRRLSTARAAPRREWRSRLDGAGDLPSGEAGLVEARDVASLRLIDCAFEHAQGYGPRLERCGGRFEAFFVSRPLSIGDAQSRCYGAHDCG